MFKIPVQCLRACIKLISSPKLIGFSLIPIFIASFFFILSLIILFSFKYEILDLIPEMPKLITYLENILFYPLCIFVSGIISVLSAFILGGFYLEKISIFVLKENGLSLSEQSGTMAFIKSLTRGLKNDSLNIAFITIISSISLICGLLPPLLFIPLFLSFFLLGYSSFEIPFSLLETPTSERINFAIKKAPSLITLGAIHSLALLLLVGGILFLPIACFVASEIYAKEKQKQA